MSGHQQRRARSAGPEHRTSLLRESPTSTLVAATPAKITLKLDGQDELRVGEIFHQESHAAAPDTNERVKQLLSFLNPNHPHADSLLCHKSNIVAIISAYHSRTIDGTKTTYWTEGHKCEDFVQGKFTWKEVSTGQS